MATIVIVVLGAIALAEGIFRIGYRRPMYWQKLAIAPQESRIMVLGNSMFKTGVDFDRLEQLRRCSDVDFNYYSGYYTNLWFLLVKNALAAAPNRPRLLVWGFRPGYARFPSFRQRRLGYLEVFRGPSEPIYEALTTGRSLSSTDRTHDWLRRHLISYAERDHLRERILEASKRTVAHLLWAGGQIATPLFSRYTFASVGDLLVSAVSVGRVEVAEEMSADAPRVDRFEIGKEVSFAGSFVPRIVQILRRAHIPQFIVIWRQAEARAPLRESRKRFSRAAKRYFDRENIAYLDLDADSRIVPDDFAEGDHYNRSGRRKITDILGKRLQRWPPITTAPRGP